MRSICFLLIVFAVSLPAVAQNAAGSGQWYAPVDQAVEDLDPLAVSRRHVDPGLGQFSDRVSVYRPLNPYEYDPFGQPGSTQYLYEQPGVRAWFNEPFYASLVAPDPKRPGFKLDVQPVIDQAFIELVPPGTVFDLTRPPPPPTAADLNPQIDNRIDYRIDSRVDTAQPPRDQPMPEPIVGHGDGAIVIREGETIPPQLVQHRLERTRREIEAAEEKAADTGNAEE